MEKYVKDRAHNRYPAYCCDDIDERVGALEEAVRALVACSVPDGSITLAKLADDARSWNREINKGKLFAEWIGTQAEYEAHLAENGGKPLANVKYIITNDQTFARVTNHFNGNGVGDLVVVNETLDDRQWLTIGERQEKLYITINGAGNQFGLYAFRTLQEEEEWHVPANGVLDSPRSYILTGTWQRIGVMSVEELEDTTTQYRYLTLWQKVLS